MTPPPEGTGPQRGQADGCVRRQHDQVAAGAGRRRTLCCGGGSRRHRRQQLPDPADWLRQQPGADEMPTTGCRRAPSSGPIATRDPEEAPDAREERCDREHRQGEHPAFTSHGPRGRRASSAPWRSPRFRRTRGGEKCAGLLQPGRSEAVDDRPEDDAGEHERQHQRGGRRRADRRDPPGRRRRRSAAMGPVPLANACSSEPATSGLCRGRHEQRRSLGPDGDRA